MFLATYGLIILIIFIFERIEKKRLLNFLPIVTIIFLIIMMGGNISNPDTVIYYNIYNSTEFFSKDFGFGIMVKIAHDFLKLDINQYRLILAIIGLGIMYKTVNKYIKNPMIYYLLYFLYPFMMDVVQVRNFLVMCILLCSFGYLLEKNRKNIIKYIILILIASSIQKTALVYLPLIFIHKIEDKKIMRKIIIVLASVSLIIGMNGRLVSIIGSMLLNTVSDNLEGSAGFLTRNTQYGWIILWGEQIVNVCLVYWCKKIFLGSQKLYCQYKNRLKISYDYGVQFFNILYWCNIYLFCFCPLYVLNINFYRIMRNVMVINILGFCLIWEISKVLKRQYRFLYRFVVFGYAVFMFYVNFFYNGGGEYIDSILKPMFKENWIMQMLLK